MLCTIDIYLYAKLGRLHSLQIPGFATLNQIQNDYPSFAHDEYNHYLYSRIIEFLKIMPREDRG